MCVIDLLLSWVNGGLEAYDGILFDGRRPLRVKCTLATVLKFVGICVEAMDGKTRICYPCPLMQVQQ